MYLALSVTPPALAANQPQPPACVASTPCPCLPVCSHQAHATTVSGRAAVPLRRHQRQRAQRRLRATSSALNRRRVCCVANTHQPKLAPPRSSLAHLALVCLYAFIRRAPPRRAGAQRFRPDDIKDIVLSGGILRHRCTRQLASPRRFEPSACVLRDLHASTQTLPPAFVHNTPCLVPACMLSSGTPHYGESGTTVKWNNDVARYHR